MSKNAPTKMSKRTPTDRNERLKRAYLDHARHAQRKSETTCDAIAAAIDDFLATNGHKPLASIHIEWLKRFSRDLEDRTNERSGEPLAASTICGRLRAVKSFVTWLADQPGLRSRIRYADADYLNPSNELAAIASAHRARPVPSMEQVAHVLATMPHGTPIERRDRAVVAFTLLTAMRDGAIASLRLRHVDVKRGRVDQDAREVRTKASKTMTTRFFPVGEEPLRIVREWVRELAEDHRFGPSDPLFPVTAIDLDADGRFAASGVKREGWTNADPIRRIFRAAFAAADLPYYSPHSFRSTIARLGERTCRTPEEFKAWSQSLGHEQVMTTFQSYGTVPSERCDELFASIAARDGTNDADEATLSLMRQLTQRLAASGAA